MKFNKLKKMAKMKTMRLSDLLGLITFIYYSLKPFVNTPAQKNQFKRMRLQEIKF